MGEVVPFPQTRPEPRRAPRPRRPEPLWREAVGRELRRERHRAGLTLADVAGRAGVSVQDLSEVERGLKEASSEALGAIAGALALRLRDLPPRVSGALRSAGPAGSTGPLALAA